MSNREISRSQVETTLGTAPDRCVWGTDWPHQTSGSIDARTARSRRSPAGRRRRLLRLSSDCFGTGREHKLSLLRWLQGASRQQMDVRFCSEQEPTAERQRAQRRFLIELATRSPEREKKSRVCQLTKTYMEAGDTTTTRKGGGGMDCKSHSTAFDKCGFAGGPSPDPWVSSRQEGGLIVVLWRFNLCTLPDQSETLMTPSERVLRVLPRRTRVFAWSWLSRHGRSSRRH